MGKRRFTGKDILLLLLYSPGKTQDANEPVIGRTRIIKMIFLFDKEVKKSFVKDSDIRVVSFPEFFPWKYGPFSKDVYNDIEFFLNNGFLDNNPLESEKPAFEIDEYESWVDDYLFEDEKDLLSHIRNEESFQLTGKGVHFAERQLYGELTNNQKEILTKFKESINRATLEAILRYTYLKYPESTKESKIKDRILG